jgi:hypothetical protein
MSRLVRLADILAIQDLNTAFAHHLDRNEIAPLVALFAPTPSTATVPASPVGARRDRGVL